MLVEVGTPYPADENAVNGFRFCGIVLVFVMATAVARPGFNSEAFLSEPSPKPRKLERPGDIVGMVVMIKKENFRQPGPFKERIELSNLRFLSYSMDQTK